MKAGIAKSGPFRSASYERTRTAVLRTHALERFVKCADADPHPFRDRAPGSPGTAERGDLCDVYMHPRPAELTALVFGVPQACDHALADQFSFEFGHCCDDLEEKPPRGSRQIQVVL